MHVMVAGTVTVTRATDAGLFGVDAPPFAEPANDRPIQRPRIFGSFGGVLGHVTGDLLVAEVSFRPSISRDGLDVKLVAPPDMANPTSDCRMR
jgi:hypothetical protein